MPNTTVARLVPSVAKTKAITGRVTSSTGNCMIPINSATMASSPAPGTPMSTKPTPTSNI
ncbi:hypothetical protein D3C78_1511630 [compost metagenome]